MIENPFYRVELDSSSGSIRSIFDKQLHRELVNTGSSWRFGQYVYVSGGDEGPNSILQYRTVSPKTDLHLHPAQNGRLISVERTPWLARAAYVLRGKHSGDSYRDPSLRKREEDRTH